ncbi:hypothetical protein BKA00_004961 [Actinomadura coerulea]|uniref:Uncharacterized protein n=1 Tax=Actinomadura coerulea TaxID=46159 RepID=A0A7X0G3H4_9ACTN|nr:hypothetical protein [Actinomadura coerulea]MBB6398047.1 hypothetical protein [Actinomadura coerulea]GGQ32617.1 hypothetical protein GCM10010187_56900 [Actinomadura coerulea]
MLTRREKIAEQGNALARLRESAAGPDPLFRAVLRERLMAAASDRSEDSRNHGRGEGRGEAVD